MSVEEIQDIIEKALFDSGDFTVMRNFMLYRHTHTMQRDGELDERTTYINSTQTIEEYIGKSDWRIMANSNTSYSTPDLQAQHN